MELTDNKFLEFKHNYPVYGTSPNKDSIGNVQRVIDPEPKFNIFVMWHPITDEASVVAYGDKIEGMLQAVYYGSDYIKNFDQVLIYGDYYEVVSVKQFNTYKLILVKKL